MAAILISGAGILAAALVSRFTPLAYTYLFGIALFGAMIVWITILLSHLGFRRAHKGEILPVRSPLFPGMQIVGVLLIGAVLITMGLDADWRLSWLIGVPWLLLLTAIYFVWKAVRARRGAAPYTTPASLEL